MVFFSSTLSKRRIIGVTKSIWQVANKESELFSCNDFYHVTWFDSMFQPTTSAESSALMRACWKRCAVTQMN